MEKKAAIALRDYVLEAKEVFDRIINSDPQSLGDLSQEKAKYNEETFEKMYDAFEEELKINVRKYNDEELIKTHLNLIFDVKNPWYDLENEINLRVLKYDFETEFLLKLKAKIIEFYDVFGWLSDEYNVGYDDLSEYINKQLEDDVKTEDKDIEIVEIKEPSLDTRFDFKQLIAECKKQGSTSEKILLLNNRMFELKQWQLQYDELEKYLDINFGVFKYRYKYSHKLYPNFEELCGLEIQRLEKHIEIEKMALTMQAIERNPVTIETRGQMPMYKWNASNTDFLELFTALYHNKSIVCFSGELPTRKEVLEYFQQIFNIEIKDVEGKLNKAGNRNRNTQFIDNLSQQFRNYVAEKESKSMSR